MVLNTIKDFLRKNKKALFFLFFIFLLFQFDLSFAVDDTQGGNENTLIDAVNMIIKIGATVLALVTELIGWFLSPSWTTGKAIGFGYHLKELWIMMSNIVYLMFAVILIWIAFMNILGKGDHWELKQAMPKFIVGVLIVPFSWFIVSAIIGISSILTASVLSIPRDSFPSVYSSLDNIKFYKTYTFNIGKSEGKDNKAIEADDETTFGEFMQDQNNLFGIMNVYTFGIMRVDTNGNLNIGDIKGKITTLTALGVKGVFDVLFFIVYLLLMIALLMALFVRGIYIWVFMVLSPFFGLMYFFGDKGPTKALNEKFSFDKFVGLAMMPVYVAGALSFGLLFILVAGKGMGASCTSDSICVKEEGGKSTVEFLGIKLIFNGTFSGSGEAKDILGGFKGAFGLLVLQIFGLAILRVSVMAALGSSELTKEVVKPIKDFGDSVGGLAKKAPTYMPIIPGPGLNMMSSSALGDLGGRIKASFDTRASNEASKAFSNLPFADKNLSEISTNMKNSSINLKRLADKGVNFNSNEIKAEARNILKNAEGDVDKLHTLKDSREALYQLMRSTGIEVSGVKTAEDIKSRAIVTKIFNQVEKSNGGMYTDLISSGGRKGVSENELVKEVKKYKNGTSSSGTDTTTADASKKTFTVGKVDIHNKTVKIEYGDDEDEKKDIKIPINTGGKIDKNSLIKNILDVDKDHITGGQAETLANKIIEKYKEEPNP